MTAFLQKLKAGKIPVIAVLIISAVLFGFVLIEYKDSDNYTFKLEKFILTDSYIKDGKIVAGGSISGETEIANSDAFFLTPGQYAIDISYETKAVSTVILTVDNDQVREYSLDPGGDVLNMSFAAPHPTSRSKIQILADEGSGLVIKDITMYADHRIYTDALFHAGLLMLLTILALLFVVRMQPVRSYKDVPDGIYLLLAAAVASVFFYMVDGGGQLLCTDTRGHMMRIEGVAEALRDGQFPVIVYPNFFNEFGQLEFLYPNLFLYPFALLRILGVSMTETYRFCMLCINILTAVCTYWAARPVFPKRSVCLAMTVLYLFMPYRTSVMLQLGATAGMGLAAAFLPLCITGYWLLLKGDKRCICYIVTGMSGILNSHVLTMIFATGFFAFMTVVNFRKLLADRCVRLRMLLLAAGEAVALNFGFLVIFLLCYISDWDKKRIQWSDYISLTMNLRAIPKSFFSWFCIFCIIVTVAFFIAERKIMADEMRTYMTELAVFAVIVFTAASNLIPWDTVLAKDNIISDLLKYIQMPHRFYILFEVCMIYLFGAFAGHIPYGEGHIKGIGKKIMAGVCVTVSALLVLSLSDEIKAYYESDVLLIDRVCGNINTLDQLDYAPEEFTTDSFRSDSAYIAGEGGEDVKAVSYSKSGTQIDLEYVNPSSAEVTAVLPLTFYEGYATRNEEGREIKVTKSDDGRVAVALEEGGPHRITAFFKVRYLYKLLYILMLAGWIAYGAALIVKKYRTKNAV